MKATKLRQFATFVFFLQKSVLVNVSSTSSRSVYFLLLILLGFAACSEAFKDAEFRQIRDVEIMNFSKNLIRIKADAVVANPNPVGMTVSTTDIDVMIEGKHEARVQKMADFTIPANGEFDLPIIFEFSPRDVFKQDILGSALSIIGNKKIDAHFTGTMLVNVGDLTKVPVAIDERYEIPLKRARN